MQNWLFLLQILLFTCQKNTSNQQQSEQPMTTAVPAELTDSLILMKIFGRIERQGGDPCLRNFDKFFSKVKTDSTQFSTRNWEVFDRRDSTEYFVEAIRDIEEQGIAKKLVLLAGTGFSCHACPGVCGGAVFSRDSVGEWRLEVFENDLAVMGTTGYPFREHQITGLGDRGFAIVLKNGSIWFGSHWWFFTVVFYEKGRFREMLESPVGYSSGNWSNAENSSEDVAYAYTAFIDFEPSGREFWDMIVHYQGTVLDKNREKTLLLDKKIRFEYKNGFLRTDEKLPDADD